MAHVDHLLSTLVIGNNTNIIKPVNSEVADVGHRKQLKICWVR